ncbi:MAG: cytochrome ubiquinol oxidase subunit I [Gammaproteobacteria bacterium]|nr:cytochrome ubiquinol oxidase subunit I [Gammaproteobacteria bacterium]
MHYPWWNVPGLTAPMLIAVVAVLHIYVSQYAVGGGILLAIETSRAHREQDAEALGYLKRHAWFFILVTVVYGAVTGVGIWWTIGLASPLATEALIHIFVFGWAIEWCFFIIEIVAAFLFYYGWDRLRPRTHAAMGYIYAWAAWISLVLITAITGFQLNPGRWPESGGFWTAFLNPQFLPQTLARTGGSLLLACLYFYLHATFTLSDDSPLRSAGDLPRVAVRAARGDPDHRGRDGLGLLPAAEREGHRRGHRRDERLRRPGGRGHRRSLRHLALRADEAAAAGQPRAGGEPVRLGLDGDRRQRVPSRGDSQTVRGVRLRLWPWALQGTRSPRPRPRASSGKASTPRPMCGWSTRSCWDRMVRSTRRGSISSPRTSDWTSAGPSSITTATTVTPCGAIPAWSA